MVSSTNQLLRLTWFNKDKALIPTENGRYGYQWVDPRDPRYCETHTLVMDEYVEGTQADKQDDLFYSERADLEPTTDNLLINGESGDVLEALTRVPELADKYVGKVKLCYIDPPFNTEKTFTHYEDNLEHSIWLTMMRDRLLHIKKLLSDDGSIWVHLDDSENHRMRVLLDEVFGPGNYVAEMIWEKTYSPRNDSTGIPMSTDPIIVYRKSEAFVPHRLERSMDMDARYKNPDNDPLGLWKPADSTAPGAQVNQQIFLYGVQHPLTGEMIYPTRGRTWNINQEWLLEVMRGWGRYELGVVTTEELEARAEVFGSPIVGKYREVRPLVIPDWNENDAQRALEVLDSGPWPRYVISKRAGTKFSWKTYLSEKESSMPTNLLRHSDVGHADGAKKEIRALFPDLTPFSTPKPERLLERIIHIATDPGDIVLDVFAGSGTTAAVAHKMGRRWVTAELLESTVETFTLPRLAKVVRGEDGGGITVTKGERVDATEDGLPEGLSPDEAQQLTSLLNKAIRDRDDLKKDKTLREVKKMVKTKNSGNRVNWRGGGGFQVAHLSPALFDYEPELKLVTLDQAAFEGDNLARGVAAHLNFHLTPEDQIFTGRRGRTRLVVSTIPATPESVIDFAAHLEDGENLIVASTSVEPDAQQALRKACKGSRILHIPNDLFRVNEIEDER